MFLYYSTVGINLHRSNIIVKLKLIEQYKNIKITCLTGKAWYIKFDAKQFAKYRSKLYYNKDTFLSYFVI